MLTNYNGILVTDSYKITHWKQYPKDTVEVYSYFESRGGIYDEIIFHGLQYPLYYLAGQIATTENINEAEDIFGEHFGNKELFNRADWEYIRDVHDGMLPIEIKAVAEGTRVPVSNVLMTVRNTDPKLPWLTNYVESVLSHVWYPSTVASESYRIKQLIKKFLIENGTPEDIDFKLHDFGLRGASSLETAIVGGTAHLINFKGTDTVPALKHIRDYYYGKKKADGHSIPASEHSTITSWGKDKELEAYKNMLTAYPTGLVACVSDSYDIYKACSEYWGTILKDEVLKRDGVLVIRPDSGDPVKVILRLLDILAVKFDFSINAKGSKVLNPKVRLIWGDGINYDDVHNILKAMHYKGWSADNIAFGMGSGLLQKLDRDKAKFAFKCSNIITTSEERPVYKEPVTDTGKQSKRGKLKLVKVAGVDGNHFKTVASSVSTEKDYLETVFLNGEIVKDYTFDSIRERANQ